MNQFLLFNKEISSFQINNFLNNLIRNPFLTLSYQMKVLLQKRKIGNFINKPNKYQLKSIFRLNSLLKLIKLCI